MLEVEIDVFSGMPNPTFQLSSREEREMLDRIMADPDQMSPVMEGMEDVGLGYRGVIVRQIKADTGAWSKATRPKDTRMPAASAARPDALPVESRLGIRPSTAGGAAEWLLQVSERRRVAISDDVREVMQAGIHRLPLTAEAVERPVEGDFVVDQSRIAEVTPRGAAWWACFDRPYYSANAQYFNVPEAVTRNNCYCFASNHLANVRYALPGRRGGRPSVPPLPQCGNVIDGLRADGWVDGCQTNTITIAMVIWPGEDYHFYRVVTGGPEWWWGHKPGATPARYTDESRRPLKQPLRPDSCDRGPYVHFCGFFYQNNDTAYVA
jgi:hypothetical protein